MTDTKILKLNGQDVLVRRLDYDVEKADGVFQDSLDIITNNLNAEKILSFGSEAITRTIIVFKPKSRLLAKMIAESLLDKGHSRIQFINKFNDIVRVCKIHDSYKEFVKEWLGFNGMAFVQKVILE